MRSREVAERLYGLPAGDVNWPALSDAVLGRQAPRAEVVGRVAELLEGGARGRRWRPSACRRWSTRWISFENTVCSGLINK